MTDGIVSGGTQTATSNCVVSKLGQISDEPPCFAIDTQILCSIENQDIYVAVQNLEPDMLVKTYNHGNRRIQLWGHGKSINRPNDWKNCFYRMPKNDLIITGRHNILCDHEITDPCEKSKQKLYIGDTQYKMDGFYMVMTAVSKDFVPLTDNDIHDYYHVVLEDDGNPEQSFAIWANDVLVESQSRTNFSDTLYLDTKS